MPTARRSSASRFTIRSILSATASPGLGLVDLSNLASSMTLAGLTLSNFRYQVTDGTGAGSSWLTQNWWYNDEYNNSRLQILADVSPITPPIPEPETYAMMLVGLTFLSFKARRRIVSFNGLRRNRHHPPSLRRSLCMYFFVTPLRRGFYLSGYRASQADFITGLNSGDLRVGIHTQGYPGGGSESLVAPIPEPETYAMMLVGLTTLARIPSSTPRTGTLFPSRRLVDSRIELAQPASGRVLLSC